MQFETIRAAAVAVKKAILDGRTKWKIFINDNRDELCIALPVEGGAPFAYNDFADVSEFLEEAETFCDNAPYSPPALEYLRGFAADEAPEIFVGLLRDLLEEAGGEIDDF